MVGSLSLKALAASSNWGTSGGGGGTGQSGIGGNISGLDALKSMKSTLDQLPADQRGSVYH